ncbi:hypothetical protein AAG570_005692 [Ranatra chinensis]|uniref:Uncharacterized protein n=1 Tax=Ranatra chinensis TaxID=642074 RepID=A0ABD0XY69_9HEMI
MVKTIGTPNKSVTRKVFASKADMESQIPNRFLHELSRRYPSSTPGGSTGMRAAMLNNIKEQRMTSTYKACFGGGGLVGQDIWLERAPGLAGKPPLKPPVRLPNEPYMAHAFNPISAGGPQIHEKIKKIEPLKKKEKPLPKPTTEYRQNIDGTAAYMMRKRVLTQYPIEVKRITTLDDN